MPVEHLQIAERFRGPPRSGNGGYTCGRIARHLQGTVAVRLRLPPPIKTDLRIESAADEARLFHGAALVGEGKHAQLDLLAPAGPSFAEAEQASRAYSGFTTHNFPGCFVCGPAREPADGLRIFPGQVTGTDVLAAPWIPDASLADDSRHVSPEFLWSALDCTGAFAVLPSKPDVAIVLGELCAAISGEITPGERCVVAGWPLTVAGRKRLAGSAVYGEDGRLVALARAVWIEVPLSDWH
jgi:hypothetical protein